MSASLLLLVMLAWIVLVAFVMGLMRAAAWLESHEELLKRSEQRSHDRPSVDRLT